MTSKEKIITISIQSRGNRIEFQDLFPRLRVLSQYQTAVLRALRLLSTHYRRESTEQSSNNTTNPLILCFFHFYFHVSRRQHSCVPTREKEFRENRSNSASELGKKHKESHFIIHTHSLTSMIMWNGFPLHTGADAFTCEQSISYKYVALRLHQIPVRLRAAHALGLAL